MGEFKKEGKSDVTQMSERDIVQEAMRQALEIAHNQGLRVGALVGFYDDQIDDLAYELFEINGDTATIGYDNEEEGKVRKEVSLSELIDLNLVRELSYKIRLGIPTISKDKIN